MEIAPEPYSYDNGDARPALKFPPALWSVAAILTFSLGVFVFLRLRWGFEEGRTASRVSATHAMVQDLSVAIKSYETDFGVYPPSGNATLVRVLQTRGPANIPYYEFPDDQLGAQHEWLDCWGNPYTYERFARGRFRLYSWGPDGKDENGGGDDIEYTK